MACYIQLKLRQHSGANDRPDQRRLRTLIKQVFPNTPAIIHLAQPQNGSSITTMLDRFVANGGKWDILGFSSYGGSTVAQSLVNAMAGFSTQFGKPFMQVEFGGPASSPELDGEGPDHLLSGRPKCWRSWFLLLGT